MAAFGEAVHLRPQDAEAYNDLGLALMQKGDAGRRSRNSRRRLNCVRTTARLAEI